MKKMFLKVAAIIFFGSSVYATPDNLPLERRLVEALNRQVPGHGYTLENVTVAPSWHPNPQGQKPITDQQYTLISVKRGHTLLARSEGGWCDGLGTSELSIGDLERHERPTAKIFVNNIEQIFTLTVKPQVTPRSIRENGTLLDYIDEQDDTRLHHITGYEVEARQQPIANNEQTMLPDSLLELTYTIPYVEQCLRMRHIVYALNAEKDLKIYLDLIVPGQDFWFVPIAERVRWDCKKSQELASIFSYTGTHIERKYRAYHYHNLRPWLPPSTEMSSLLLRTLQLQIEAKRARMDGPVTGDLADLQEAILEAPTQIPLGALYLPESNPKLQDSKCIGVNEAGHKSLMQHWAAHWISVEYEPRARSFSYYTKTDCRLPEADGWGPLGAASPLWPQGMYRHISSCPVSGAPRRDESWRCETGAHAGQTVVFRHKSDMPGVASEMVLDEGLLKAFLSTDIKSSLVRTISLKGLKIKTWDALFRKRAIFSSQSIIELACTTWHDVEPWSPFWNMLVHIRGLQAIEDMNGWEKPCFGILVNFLKAAKANQTSIVFNKFNGSQRAKAALSVIHPEGLTFTSTPRGTA